MGEAQRLRHLEDEPTLNLMQCVKNCMGTIKRQITYVVAQWA